MTQSMQDVLKLIVSTFGEAVEKDEEIDGADAVDSIVSIYRMAKAALAAEAPMMAAEEEPAARIVVFADHGITRSVAVQGFSEKDAPECVVVDYDNCEGSKAQFERELLGTTREAFDEKSLYVW